MQNNTGRLLLITVVSIAVKGELAKETVNYDTEIKTYQYNCQQYIPKSTEKIVIVKLTISVKSLPQVSTQFMTFQPFSIIKITMTKEFLGSTC